MDHLEARQILGERIRTLLEQQNLSVRGFALMVGLSKDYIVDLEFGRKSPTLDTLVKVAAGFGMTPSELLKGIGNPADFAPSEPNATKPQKDEGNDEPHYYFSGL